MKLIKPKGMRNEEFNIKSCLIKNEFNAVYTVQVCSDHLGMLAQAYCWKSRKTKKFFVVASTK